METSFECINCVSLYFCMFLFCDIIIFISFADIQIRDE